MPQDKNMLKVAPIKEEPDHPESLLLSIHALLEFFDEENRIDYEDLAGWSGVAFLLAAHPDECPYWWGVGRRETYLPFLGDLIGLGFELLEQNPGLPPAEAEQYFQTRLAPRLAAAVDQGSPVLVQGGWPDERSVLWGIVTGYDANLKFSGTTVWSNQGVVPLATAPKQVYLVSRLRPQGLSRKVCYQIMRQAADLIENKAVRPEYPGWLTGLPAYDLWCDKLGQPPFCPKCGDKGWSCHVQVASLLWQGRNAARRFWARAQTYLGDKNLSTLMAIVAHEQKFLAAVKPHTERPRVRDLMSTPDGTRQLISELRVIRGLDEEFVRLLRTVLANATT